MKKFMFILILLLTIAVPINFSKYKAEHKIPESPSPSDVFEPIIRETPVISKNNVFTKEYATLADFQENIIGDLADYNNESTVPGSEFNITFKAAKIIDGTEKIEVTYELKPKSTTQ